MSLNLAPELQDDLDAHLDAVDAALVSGGKPRRERQEVLDSLTDQTLEMLSREAGDATPSQRDLAAVLRQLDPPSAYATAPTTSAAVTPPGVPLTAARRLDPQAVWALALCASGGLVPWGIALSDERSLPLAIALGAVALVIGTVLGINSIIRTRAAPAQWYGYPIAFFAVIAVPTVLLSFSHVPIVGPLVSMAHEEVFDHYKAREDWLFSVTNRAAHKKHGDWEEMRAKAVFPEPLQARPKPWILRYEPALFLVPIAILFAATMWINVKLYRRFKPAGPPPAASVA